MSDFTAKMRKIRFLLGIRTRPRWGAYSAPIDPLAVFMGPTSKGREGEKEGRGREREGKRRGREEEGPAPQIFWPRTAPDDLTLGCKLASVYH